MSKHMSYVIILYIEIKHLPFSGETIYPITHLSLLTELLNLTKKTIIHWCKS